MASRQMKLALVNWRMRAGGAERVMSLMANHWAAQGWEVTLITSDDGREPPFYPLDPAIRWRPLDFVGGRTPLHSLGNLFRHAARIRRTLLAAHAEAVIAFTEEINVLTVLATRGTGIPCVISERNNPVRRRLPLHWRALRRLTYPQAEQVVLQTERTRRFFSAVINRRAMVIPNPVPPLPASELPSPAEASTDHRRLVTIGRLHAQKGHDLLIEAMARLGPAADGWTLEIWGEGSERDRLEALIVASGLTGRVRLCGRTSDVAAVLRGADLFVMASRYEGFPNALTEAMAAGLPVLSTDCDTGPAEIIRPGLDGLLVPPEDVAALTAGLGRLMGDDSLRRQLAQRAPEVLVRFSMERVMGAWENLLTMVAA